MAKYGIFDANGLPLAFYDDAIHGVRRLIRHEDGGAVISDEPNPACKIPLDAIEISFEQWELLSQYQGKYRWNGEDAEPYQPPLTLDEYKAAFDAHLDATAQERQYDNRLTIVAYVASTNPQWAAEAQAFVAWRDVALNYMFTQLAAVEAGGNEQPTIEDFIGGIPPIDWPEA